MNNSHVAHKWANEAAAKGRGSNFYFQGGTLYSYGPHFVVGRIVRNKKGRRAYLLNAGSYSPSTGRHQTYARRAIADGETIFHVADPTGSHDMNRANYRARMASSLANVPGARSARTLRRAIDGASEMAREYNAYSDFYTLRGRVKIPSLSDADAERLARYQSLSAEREARDAARSAVERAEREARDALRCAEARDKFRAGGSFVGYVGGPCMLRLHGDVFQTSHGAEVERGDGIAMLAFIAGYIRLGSYGAAIPDAPSANGFQLRSISAETVIIGCHHIPVSECAAMAALVGIEWPS